MKIVLIVIWRVMRRIFPYWARTALILCLLQGVLPLFAQTGLHLEKVEGEGMPGGYIKCIGQDKKGFIWFGTQEGLFRYDGYSFRPFRNDPGDPGTIGNNDIESLYPENDMLWVGSRGGLSRIDTRSLIVRNFPAAEPLSVYSLFRRDDSHFLAGTNQGLFIFTTASGKWERAADFDKRIFIRNLTPGPHGDLYMTTHDGIYIYNMLAGSYRHIELPVPPDNKSRLPIAHRSLLDTAGNLWVTTWNAGLVKFNPMSGALSVFAGGKSIAHYISAYDLFMDGQGKIWTANSENGVTIFDASGNVSSSARLFWDPGQAIPDRVYSLFCDRTGICWVGTENGIYKSDPHKLFLPKIDFVQERISKDLPRMRSDLTPLSMLIDRKGRWWMGTYEGLYVFDAATGMLRNHSAAAGIPPHVLVNALLEDEEGNIWVAARERMIRLAEGIRKGERSKSYTAPSLKSTITTIYTDHLKRIWLGTHSSGVYRFDTKTGQFTAYPCTDTAIAIDKNEIRSFIELSDGTILLGGERTGLIRFDPSTGHYEKAEPFNKNSGGSYLSIYCLVKDAQGKIWIGAEGSGLWETDEHFSTMRHYSGKDGLPSMNILAVVPAPNDHIWLMSEGGIVDYRPLRHKMTVFGKEAGVRNLYNLLSMIRLANGSMAIGDMGCMHILDGNGDARNLTPPEVVITGFKVFDSSYLLPDSVRPELKYDQNAFSFEYTALNYTQPSHNQYAYMLEGVDQKWNEAGTRRYVSYANLEEGAYTFKVKACNNEGIWNETPAVFSFVIRPPFWHRWWFYLLMAMLLVSGSYALYSIRQGQLQGKEQLRNKIARDLHDDIGSTLSGINIFSRIALQKLDEDREASGELLRRIHQRSEKTMEALSDIVWSINTRKDDIENVLARMREYLGEVLEPMEINYTFSIDPRAQHLHIGMEIRRDIYLIFKEAVNNASKYAGCDLIRIELKKEHNKVMGMVIEDNGKGFVLHSATPGNGINNMQERAARIGGQLHIDSEPGRGTRVVLIFPLT